MPFGYCDLALRTVDDGLSEGDGEADGRAFDLVVVGVVVDEAAEVVRVELEMTSEDGAEAPFVVVAFGGLDRQAKEVSWIDGLNLRRAGEEDVLKGWRLENTIIGKVQDRVGGGEVARDGEARL